MATKIFKAGRWTDSAGVARDFDRDALAAMVDGFDPQKTPAPIVIGHPGQDSPAFGWVERLALEDDGSVTAEFGQLDPDFEEAVRQGRYARVSAKFFLPDHPSNPTPGALSLRHVGFLGGAAPAVPGLGVVQFADAGEGATLEAAFSLGADDVASIARRAIRVIRRLLGRLRDQAVADRGVDAGDELISDWDLSALDEMATELDASPAYAAMQSLAPTKAAPSAAAASPVKETAMPVPTGTPDAAELDRRAKDLEAREAAFAAERQKARMAEDVALVDELVAGGQLPPAQKDLAVATFAAFTDDGEAAFAVGDETITPRGALARLLKALPKQSVFDPAPPAPDAAAAFAAPPGFQADPDRLGLHARAQAYAAENKVTYREAVAAVAA